MSFSFHVESFQLLETPLSKNTAMSNGQSPSPLRHMVLCVYGRCRGNAAQVPPFPHLRGCLEAVRAEAAYVNTACHKILIGMKMSDLLCAGAKINVQCRKKNRLI